MQRILQVLSRPSAHIFLMAAITISSFAAPRTEASESNYVGVPSKIANQLSPKGVLIAANSSADITAAWNLYTQHQYAASADAFETLIRTATPSARLYYYAGLANRDAARVLRAKQLFEYVVKNFPTTQEATFAQRLLPAKPTSASETELPESVRNALPKEMQSMLNTEIGRAAIKAALLQQGQTVAVIRAAETQGVINKKNPIPTPAPPAEVRNKGKDHPFTPEDIAKDGAGGVDQSRYPNCWFEASMSALAGLPRGQRLIASMIRYGTKPDEFIVRFPNDGVEYDISKDDLTQSSIQDKAMWASILDCAQCKKFPDNVGASGADMDQSRLEVGLGCITGCKAEVINFPKTISVEELSSFIDGGVKSHNPIVAGTYPAGMLGTLPDLIVPQHAYTIIGFDPAKALITIRNPHGKDADRFSLESDPNHQQFEQLNDGVFKMSLPLFQKYFSAIARSFI